MNFKAPGSAGGWLLPSSSGQGFKDEDTDCHYRFSHCVLIPSSSGQGFKVHVQHANQIELAVLIPSSSGQGFKAQYGKFMD